MEQADVIILGGGLVGLTLALALDAHGLSSHVIDTADLKNSVAPSFDGRVSAISSSSMKMMDAIGIGARLRPHGCPIARISVTEGLSHSPLLFDSTEGGAGDPLGHMVENRLLRLALLDAVAGAGNVTLNRSEEHTSELQSLMRISYAVFCLK